MKFSILSVVSVVASLSLIDGRELIMASNKDMALRDQWIVVMKPERFDYSLTELKSTFSNEVQIQHTYNTAIQGFSAEMSLETAEALANNPNVKSVEQDSIVTVDDLSWGLDRIDERSLPTDGLFSPAFDSLGSGVTAYIIDTGIGLGHEDFEGRAAFGINTSGDTTDDDCNGHGTHVAGTVGGATYGVARSVNLIAVKVLNCQGSGSFSGVIAGMDWVAAHAKTSSTSNAVVNMSLGGGTSATVNSAVEALHDSGVSVVVASGNSNIDACARSPASEPKAITVASSDNNDSRSSFSNYGDCVDIFAPGRNILSAWIGSSNTTTRKLSGTSMAAPHVSGAAALALGENSNLSPDDVADLLTNRASKNKITNAKTVSNHLVYVGETTPTQSPTATPPTPAPTPCMQNTFELTLKTDRYPSDISWDLYDRCSETIKLSGEDYTLPLTNYSEVECLHDAKYTFIIRDSFGDGLCCSFGEGGYSVKFNGVQIKSGADFGSSDSVDFGTCEDNLTESPSTIPFPTISPITFLPTGQPSLHSSHAPSMTPSLIPTDSTTENPTTSITSQQPTSDTSHAPSKRPSLIPTFSPTESPTMTTMTPTYLSTNFPSPTPTLRPTCKEQQYALFFKGRKNGNDTTKSCDWLKNQKTKKIRNICRSTDEGLGVKSASEVCIETCEEFKRFIHYKNKKRTCRWLSRQPSKIPKICKNSAGKVCYVTCATCPLDWGE